MPESNQGSSMPTNARIYTSDQGFDSSAITVASSGNNTVYTPAAGKRVALYYLCLSAAYANSASVVVSIKLGGVQKYKVELAPGAIWARNIGAGRFAFKGAVDATLVANLSVAQTVHVSIEREDLDA